MINLRPGSHVHLMGICGTAMASLAGLLQDSGYKVTGSDSNPYPPMSTQLENLKIPVKKGYSKDNLHPEPDFVIVGNVISAGNEEAQEMVRLQIPHTSLPKAVGEFVIEDRQSIVIAGTHGKTTTTSMMAWVSAQLGLKPGFLIGGIPKNFSRSFQNPHGNYFVIEGDEYDTAYFDKVPKFVHYKPRHVILTSIEFDHADIYKDLEAVKAAFVKLLELIPDNGTLVYWAEDANISSLRSHCQARQIWSYGLGTGDYRAEVLTMSEAKTTFRVYFKEAPIGDFELMLGGNFNVLNALSVIALSHQQKWDMTTVKTALASFQGVKRRQEILGEPGGVLVIEDFAHHPTAVRETILAIQKKFEGRRVFSVFEPRSATSRRKVFQQDYVKAFSVAQEIVLAEAFDQSKIDTENRFSSAQLIEDLRHLGKSARVFSSSDEIVKDLVARSKKNDVILIMSNGGFDGIYSKLLTALKEKAS